MTATLNAMVGGVSTSIRLLAGEDAARGFISVVDGAAHYKQNIPAGVSNFALENVAGDAGDHLAKVFAVVKSSVNAQLILKDGNTVLLAATAAASGTGSTVEATGTAWAADEFKDKIVEIVSGTGAGQHRKVIGNDADTLTVDHAFATAPDATSTFIIYEGIELLPYDTPLGVYGISPGIKARNAGGWKLTTDSGVVVPLVTGSFS